MTAPAGQRLASLDATRGLTVLAMILVNNPGSGPTYPQLTHAPWLQGWTIADLIAPVFVWVVGVSLPLALVPKLESGTRPLELLWPVVRRGALLVGIGILLAGVPGVIPLADPAAIAAWRIPGVLQRIGICYVIGAAFVLAARPRALALAALGCSALHWLILMRVPTPGFPPGDLSPAGYLGWYLNRQVFGAHAEAQDEYGILSTLGAIASVLLGAVVGSWLRSPTRQATSARLVAAGLGGVALALLLGIRIPLSRHLWSPSFVLLTSGVGCLVLGLARAWLDHRPEIPVPARPLVATGRNALLVFVLTILVGAVIGRVGITTAGGEWRSVNALITAPFAAVLPPAPAALAVALGWAALSAALALWLHHRRWYAVL